ncbi:hypothetical protein WJX74_003827 [Apatococcus lobatus]|uniref:Uncharacterized protein n=1 Tax=Apatococcus lobatus TaxID=904363 RepID=A0AAW1QUP3_9CHLO
MLNTRWPCSAFLFESDLDHCAGIITGAHPGSPGTTCSSGAPHYGVGPAPQLCMACDPCACRECLLQASRVNLRLRWCGRVGRVASQGIAGTSCSSCALCYQAHRAPPACTASGPSAARGANPASASHAFGPV